MAASARTNGNGAKSNSGRIEIGGEPKAARTKAAPAPQMAVPQQSAAAPAPLPPPAEPKGWPADSTATVYEPKPRSAPAAAPTPAAPAAAPPDEAASRTRARSADYKPAYGKSPRRPADERENAFQGVAWLLEGITGVVEELRHSDLGLSEEFWVHAYAARRESLLALRTAVDQLIEKVDAADREEEAKRQRRERRGGIEISK